ncbi:MAG: L-threonylcarbamoyladenylate synthase [Pseudomonadota bacterium]|nr:L-threonylcarbamoyladenylate synthase [Pseudomonadota bacterium]
MASIVDIRREPGGLAQAVAALGRGECVAVPTETVYGLAADATNGEAVARIFEMKGRPRFNPLIAHVASLVMAAEHGVFCTVAERLAAAFWPGPLTLVLARRPGSAVHELVTAGLDTLALRLPRGPSQALIETFGRPLAAPSANRSGRVSPTTAEHVVAEFAGDNLLVLDNGPCAVGLESTIVKVTGEALVVLRPGAVTEAEMGAVTGLPVVAADPSGGIEAPGMLASHYAPKARLVLNITACPAGAGLIAFGAGAGRNRSRAGQVLNLSPDGDLKEAAANLYAHLKALDAQGFDPICVEPVPWTGIGAAINDRLARAAAPRP